jgi:hypothetical protein
MKHLCSGTGLQWVEVYLQVEMRDRLSVRHAAQVPRYEWQDRKAACEIALEVYCPYKNYGDFGGVVLVRHGVIRDARPLQP